MKRVALVLVALLALCAPGFAGETLAYPTAEKALFTITFPDKWTTKFDDKGQLHAFTENWECYWLLSIVEGNDAANTKAEEKITKQIEEWVKDYTYDEKAIEKKVNEIDWWIWNGKGVDNYKESKNFGKPCQVIYYEFQPKEGVVGHIVSFGTDANLKKYAAELDAIIGSVKLAKAGTGSGAGSASGSGSK